MPTIIRKYSDNGRTNVLNQTINTAKADKAKGIHYVSDETVQGAEALLPEWISITNILNRHLSERSKEVREKNEGIGFLDLVVRDMWAVLKRRVKRNNEPPEVLTYYELSQNGAVPRSLSDKDLLAKAAKMIKGDAKAVEAGYPAMLNPEANELKQALDKAKKEIADVAPADRAYDMAEEEVEKMRPEVDNLINDIIDELRFNLRKKDGASQRRIIKSYGIEIQYNKNEPVDANSSIVDEE